MGGVSILNHLMNVCLIASEVSSEIDCLYTDEN